MNCLKKLIMAMAWLDDGLKVTFNSSYLETDFIELKVPVAFSIKKCEISIEEA